MYDLDGSESLINELDVSAILKRLFNHVAEVVELGRLIVDGLHGVKPVDQLIQLLIELFGLVADLVVLAAHVKGLDLLAEGVEGLIYIHETIQRIPRSYLLL